MGKIGSRPLGAKQRRRPTWVIVALLAVVAAVGLWGGLRRGPAPTVQLDAQYPAIGRSNRVVAHFAEPVLGLGMIRLELIQGERTVVLAEGEHQRPGPYSVLRHGDTPAADLDAVVGSDIQAWLKEGPAVLRATADRMSGPLRVAAPVVVERTFQVRLRPPHLEILSHQHYVSQGGSGVVVLRPGDAAVHCGVRAGSVEFASWALPGGTGGERFVLFAVPWDLDQQQEIRAFAVDDAGNRAELPFVDLFKREKPSTDTITLSDAFLERVVPAISSQTPGLDDGGSLFDRYLEINGDLRMRILADIHELGQASQPVFLAHGAFLQLPSSVRRAGFADSRSYIYQGRVVDHQTHLGLDLASTAGAPVPAGNAGKVVHAGWLGIYGNGVILDHGYGLMSLYGHLSQVDVKVGDRVARGDTVGRTGATGLAGGDHLHFEIFVQGISTNPMEWLDPHWIRDNVASKVPYPMP